MFKIHLDIKHLWISQGFYNLLAQNEVKICFVCVACDSFYKTIQALKSPNLAQSHVLRHLAFFLMF